ncbi:integrase domain-containing protein, partial [Burkholderia sp. SIMBA_019]
VIAAIEKEEPIAAAQLRLMWRFGLRVEEALKLRPAIALGNGALRVDEGSKGGRKRLVPITHPVEQYAALEAAARLANSRTGSTIPDAHSYD